MKQGLRSVVHAFRDAVPAAARAGCTQIEHGLGATDADLKLMAERGTYFDPQGGLLLENYLSNREKEVETPCFPTTLEGLATSEKILPMNHVPMRLAANARGLKTVFVNDA